MSICISCGKGFEQMTDSHLMLGMLCQKCKTTWNKQNPQVRCNHEFDRKNYIIEDGYKIFVCKCGAKHYEKCITNFEKIKEMTIEEVAKTMSENFCPVCKIQKFCGLNQSDNCLNTCRIWLESEAI